MKKTWKRNLIAVGHAAMSKTPHEWDCSHIIDIR